MPALTVPVDAGPRRLGALADTAGEEAIAAVLAAAEPLRGLRVAHLATPPFAPGALDRLRSTVPLLRDVGLDVRWLAVAGDDRADAAARAGGDALRGGEPGPAEDVTAWRARGAEPAAEVPRATDVVVVHGVEGLAALVEGHTGSRRAPRRGWWAAGDVFSPARAGWGGARATSPRRRARCGPRSPTWPARPMRWWSSRTAPRRPGWMPRRSP